MQVTAGPPVELDDLRGRPITPEVLRNATERIMGDITALLAGIRGETPPAVAFDPRKAGLTRTGKSPPAAVEPADDAEPSASIDDGPRG